MMIFSARVAPSPSSGFDVTVKLSTKPTRVELIQSNGKRKTLTFKQTDDTLTVNVPYTTGEHELALDTETKKVKFNLDFEIKELKGEIKLNGPLHYLYLPICKKAEIKIDFYSDTGERLTVSRFNSNRLYDVKGLSTSNYLGINVPCLIIDLDKVIYLANKETNFWRRVTDINFRLVISNLKRPLKGSLVEKKMPEFFYEKSYYLDHVKR